MTERFEGEIKKGGIRGEHEALLLRLELGSVVEEPVVFVGPGEKPGELMVSMDVAKLGLNHSEATSIETLDKLLENPDKPWRGPSKKGDIFKAFGK